MLKIIDNYDLKHLEDYGFKKVPCGDYMMSFQDTLSGAISIRIFDDRSVYPKSDLSLYNMGNNNEIKMYDTLYDMIKDGIVEKI